MSNAPASGHRATNAGRTAALPCAADYRVWGRPGDERCLREAVLARMRMKPSDEEYRAAVGRRGTDHLAALESGQP